MKIRINGITYTGVKKNSLAWKCWQILKAMGYIIVGLANAFILWAFTSFIIIVFG